MDDFKSKLITQELLERADLIIGMERYHLLRVRKKFKEIKEKLRSKLFTLLEFNGIDKKEANIPDPYNRSIIEYFKIMKIVDETLKS